MSLADRDAPIDRDWLVRSWREHRLRVTFDEAMANPTTRRSIRNHALVLIRRAEQRALRFDQKRVQAGND